MNHPRSSLSPAEVIALRAAVRRRRALRIIGTVLIGYGVLGIGLFAAVALAIDRPIDQAGELTVSIEGQRGALLDSLQQASTTIDQSASGVRGMQTSLVQARAATDRASTLSRGVATSMYQLRDAMAVSILGTQPLIGLATSFDQAGQQLELLGEDVAAIGQALEENRDDAETVAAALDNLRSSVEDLTERVREGPRLEVASKALAQLRLGLYAVVAWMAALAVGSVVGGLACWIGARR